MPAGAVQPCDSNAVTFFQVGNPRPEGNHNPCSFVTRYERQRWFDWPIALSSMQICVTYSARNDFYQGLPWPR